MYSSLTGFRATGLDKDGYRRDLQSFFKEQEALPLGPCCLRLLLVLHSP